MKTSSNECLPRPYIASQEELAANEKIFAGKALLAKTIKDDEELWQMAGGIVSYCGNQVVGMRDVIIFAEAQADKAYQLLSELPNVSDGRTALEKTRGFLWLHIIKGLAHTLNPKKEKLYVYLLLEARGTEAPASLHAFEAVVRENLKRCSVGKLNKLLHTATLESNEVTVRKAWQTWAAVATKEELLALPLGLKELEDMLLT